MLQIHSSKHFVFLAFIFTFCTGPTAPAQESRVQCFEYVSEQSPQRISESFVRTISESESFADVQVWCYWQGPKGELFLFNNDQPELREELALLVEADPKNGHRYFTQGVRSQGQTRMVKARDPGFSPFNIPLNIDEAAKQASPVSALSWQPLDHSIHQMVEKFRSVSLSAEEDRNYSLKGISLLNFQEEENLADEKMPYDAYWWPHRNVPLAAGDHSPLGKYDRAQTVRTGINPNSVEWEQRVHSLEHVDWGGHCNGWAASSVLYEKWADRLWDESIQSVVLPSDVDGLRAEASFCVNWAFYGRRYNGRSGDDIADIYADKFHKVLRYYLKYQKKAIAVDYFVEESVDNNVITGYQSNFTAIADRPGWFQVETQVRMHDYGDRHELVQTAEIEPRTYHYKLQLDENRNILAGEWNDDEDHPDFLWVPLAQRKCGRENPNLDHNQIESWIQALPKAERRRVEVNWEINDTIGPNESLELVLPVALKGIDFSLEISANGYEEKLRVKGVAEAKHYPLLRDSQPYKTGWKNLRPDTKQLNFEVTNLTALKVKNTSGQELIPTGPLVIKAIHFWGAPEPAPSN